MQENFDDFIRSRINSHEAPVPPGAWENITAKKKKKRRLLFWWSSALLLTGLTIGTGYLLLQTDKSIHSVTANRTISGGQKTSSASNTAPAISTTENNNNLTIASVTPIAGAKDVTSTAPVGIETSNININEPLALAPGAASILQKEKSTSGTVTNSSTVLLHKNHPTHKKTKGRLRASAIAAAQDEPTVRLEKTEGVNNLPVTALPEIASQEDANTVKNEETAASNAIAKETSNKKTEAAVSENKKESTTLNAAKRHWYLDAGIMPLVALQQYDENISFNRTLFFNNNRSILSAKLISTSLEPAIAFSFSARREFGKKIHIGAGIQYLVLKENIRIEGKERNIQYTVVNRLVDGSLIPDTVETVTEGNRTITAVNSYRLVSIPVFVQYQIINKNSWGIGAMGGCYININSRYQNEIDKAAAAPLVPANGQGNTATLGCDVFAGIRVTKSAGNRILLYAIPTLRWSLGSYAAKNSLIQKTINQAGVSMGLSYRIF